MSKKSRSRAHSVNGQGYRIGQSHQRAKLTDHDVDLIVALAADGMPYRLIAKKFEISFSHVGWLVRGERRAQTACT